MRTSLCWNLGALALLIVQTHGHGAGGLPRVFGSQGSKALGMEPYIRHRAVRTDDSNALLQRRQSSTKCGPGIGACGAGLCCSVAGYCGTGSDYCTAPDCQFQYGPACDASATPAGVSTLSIPRPLIGSVPYGAGIYDCYDRDVVALTFDDGPWQYTNDLLDILKQYNAKATFFVTGNNLGKGAIDTTWATVIRRIVAEGHQIASHTWSHQRLSVATPAELQDQMIKNEMAFRNILGYFPTYMRPPFLDCYGSCQDQLKSLGYHAIFTNVDTKDYANDAPQLIQNSKGIFDGAVNGRNPASSEFLVLAHDVHEQTVHNLTAYMLQRMASLGYRSTTIGDCLHDPIANWYRPAGSVSVPAAAAVTAPVTVKGSGKISTDGMCGPGITCIGSTFGNCCSQYNWCGSTPVHCGSGCQSGSGTCA